jgi:hypothetical protein
MVRHFDSIALALLVFSSLVFILHLINVFKSGGRGKGKKRWFGVTLSGAVAAGCIFIYLRLVVPWPSPFAIKFDAIRMTREDIEAVDLSLRCYDKQQRLIRRVYTKGKLDPKVLGTSWKSLDDKDYKTISTRSLSAENLLQLRIVLNPGRLMTPPDAIFSAALNLPKTKTDPTSPVAYLVQSEDEADLELRLLIIRK